MCLSSAASCGLGAGLVVTVGVAAASFGLFRIVPQGFAG
jgi:hypothetical protein